MCIGRLGREGRAREAVARAARAAGMLWAAVRAAARTNSARTSKAASKTHLRKQQPQSKCEHHTHTRRRLTNTSDGKRD